MTDDDRAPRLPTLLRPLLDPQAALPPGSGPPASVAARVAAAHLLHHVGCWPPVLVACAPPLWPLLPLVFWRATAQHREDFRAALESVRNAAR